MFSIAKCPIPLNSQLARYSRNGNYTDCYLTEIPRQVSFPEYVFAFYTTSLFKLERLILRLALSKASADHEARQLSNGLRETFAAWHVEDRSENELLMCDFGGRTRSWLMVAPIDRVNSTQTRLFFGSAVVPILDPKTGKLSLGFNYQSLLGFHKVYSVLLLYSATVHINHNHLRDGK